MPLTEAEQFFAAALDHHRAGRLPEAEALYQRVLAADPHHLMGLHFFGVLAHQTGRSEAAIGLLGKAISLNDRIPDCHYNIGSIFQTLGRLDEAAKHYSRAIEIKPDFAEAHYELANILAQQEKFEGASTSYKSALAIKPDFIDALTNLGNVVMKQGKPDQAQELWHRAVTLHPQHLIARMNIALVLKQQFKLDEAAAQLRHVLSLKPDYAEAHYNLGNTLHLLGQWDAARAAYRTALVHKPDFPDAFEALVGLLLTEDNIVDALNLSRRALVANETQQTKSVLASCLKSPVMHPGMGDLRDLLARALSEAWDDPGNLAATGARFLPLDSSIRDGIARAVDAWPNLLPPEELLESTGLTALAEDKLFLALLESSPLCGVELERFATGLRRNLLTAGAAGPESATPESILNLYCALARQCFINDYVFAQSAPEIEEVRALHNAVLAAIGTGAAIPAVSLAAIAAYMPLHTLPGAASLLDRQWPQPIIGLLAQQVGAQIEEQSLRSSMPLLTVIEDQVSRQVRAQYEENPYPKWSKIPLAVRRETVDAFIRKLFPRVPFAESGRNEGVDILVAGCGTGRYLAWIASNFVASRVLAVDLSLASLAYAQKQAHALDLTNIQFGQADILKLTAIDRTFDIIDSSGVLHHLANPRDGWRSLLSMLRSGGFMSVGLYSEIARRDIVTVRDFITERGYLPSADDIRRCRQELLNSADGTPLKNVTAGGDFFSLSECRDLLFHVQEHRLTLPEIGAFIAENNLRFLGFVLDPRTQRSYARRFPDDLAMTDLAQWHQYEIENPHTFGSMYQFWVQKK